MTRPNWRQGRKSASAPKAAPAPSESTSVPTSSEVPDAYETTFTTFVDTLIEGADLGKSEWSSEPWFDEQTRKLRALGAEKGAEGRKLALLFYSDFGAYFAMITKKDDAFFSLPHPLFSELKASTKWASLSMVNRDKVWSLGSSLVQLGTLANLYSKCSQPMLKTLSGFSTDLFAKLQSGELDMATMNPMALGQMVMGGLDAADLEEFGRSIASEGNLETLMSTMTGALSSDPKMSGAMGLLSGALGGSGGMAGLLSSLSTMD